MQNIDLMKLAKLPYVIYDKTIYEGKCGYIKTPEMIGKVTIFPSGKMISIGGKTIKKAIEQIHQTKSILVQENLISDVKIKPQIRNIVSIMDLQQSIPIDILSSKIPGSVYTPETFPALIIKGLASCSFTIFANGKIIIMGAKSIKELNTSSFDLQQRIKSHVGLEV